MLPTLTLRYHHDVSSVEPRSCRSAFDTDRICFPSSSLTYFAPTHIPPFPLFLYNVITSSLIHSRPPLSLPPFLATGKPECRSNSVLRPYVPSLLTPHLLPPSLKNLAAAPPPPAPILSSLPFFSFFSLPPNPSPMPPNFPPPSAPLPILPAPSSKHTQGHQ